MISCGHDHRFAVDLRFFRAEYPRKLNGYVFQHAETSRRLGQAALPLARALRCIGISRFDQRYDFGNRGEVHILT